MKQPKIIYPEKLAAGVARDPKFVSLQLSERDGQKWNVPFNILRVPVITAGLLYTAQEAGKKINLSAYTKDMAENFEHSMNTMPEVFNLALADDGNTLVLHLGIGSMAFKMTDQAKLGLTVFKSHDPAIKPS